MERDPLVVKSLEKMKEATFNFRSWLLTTSYLQDVIKIKISKANTVQQDEGTVFSYN